MDFLKKIVVLGLFSFPVLVQSAEKFQLPRSTVSRAFSQLPSESTLFLESAVIQPPRGSTLLIGRGYNSVSASVGGPCVEVGTLETLNSSSTGQKIDYSMEEVKTLDQLRDVLGINFSGSLGLGTYGGDLKAQYYSENNFSSNNYFLALKVSVENQTEVLKEFKLTPEAKSLLEKGKSFFLKGCGNEFIAARVTGGEFIAIIEIETSSKEEKNTISSQIGASGVFWKTQAEVSNVLSHLLQKSKATVKVFRSGDLGELPQLEPKALIDYALKFPSKVLSQSVSAWPFLVSTQSYDSILDKPTEDVLSLSVQQNILENLAALQDRAKGELSEIQFIQENTDKFETFDRSLLLSGQGALKVLLTRIRESAQNCALDPESICSMPELKWPTITLPLNKETPAAVAPPPPQDTSEDSEDSVESMFFFDQMTSAYRL